MDKAALEERLAELPLYSYGFFDPRELEFTDRVLWVCEHECPMYGTTWACPPAVGAVEECRKKCMSYPECLMIASVTEVSDISNIDETLATRPAHEELTEQAAALLREQGENPYILSTQACAICQRCAFLDNQPCRFPEKMHPCVESHGINVVPILEKLGLDFQFGANIVTWISLLLF